MINEPSETERYLRIRIEELEMELEAMRAEFRATQQELWKRER